MNKIRLTVELIVAAGCAVLAGFVSDLWSESQYLSVVSTLSSLAGTLMGFVIAALAILATITEKTLILNMKKTGHFQVLIQDLFFGAACYGFCLACFVPALLVNVGQSSILIAVGIGGFAMAGLRMVRAGRNFMLTMLHL